MNAATAAHGGFSLTAAKPAIRAPSARPEPVIRVVEQIYQLKQHIMRIEAQLKASQRASVASQQLRTIFGVGLITATACAAEYCSSVARFSDSRQFAASIGITPREHASGEKRRQGRITKRGNPYLRKLLVQDANTIVNRCQRREDALCRLARRLFAAHKTRSAVIVAVANHLARMIYAVLKHRTPYCPQGRDALPQAA